MTPILSTLQPDFAQKFDRIVDARRESDSEVAGQVADILQTVKLRGDAALSDYTQRFDGYTLADDGDWLITRERCEQAYHELDPDLRDALELAAARIRAYHEAQLPADRDYVDAAGVQAGCDLAASGCGGAVCSGRPRGLSVLAADERHSGAGCRG